MFILGFFSVLCTQRLPPKSGCLKRSGNLTSCGSLSTATISTFEIQQISSMPFKVSINHLLPPANEVCEGYVFIGVCLSTGGVSASGPGGCLPPPPQADTPLGKHAPGQTPLPQGKHPLNRHPPGQTHPTPLPSAGIHTPPPNACLDTPPYGGYYRIRSTSGWYTSHWNAFVFYSIISKYL